MSVLLVVSRLQLTYFFASSHRRFIISLVVGSMAVVRPVLSVRDSSALADLCFSGQVKPFEVHPGPFLRDVGFALAAIFLLLWILHDGELEAWEALALIALYAGYVVWILIGPRVLEWRSRGREASEEARVGESSCLKQLEVGRTDQSCPSLSF